MYFVIQADELKESRFEPSSWTFEWSDMGEVPQSIRIELFFSIFCIFFLYILFFGDFFLEIVFWKRGS